MNFSWNWNENLNIVSVTVTELPSDRWNNNDDNNV
jgi:hypothetical protein